LLQQSDKTQITTKSLSNEALENIKSLIQPEDADFEIVTPMEKLESFFIRTVTDAQAKAAPTSGAVSTTQLGEFLTAEAAQKKILDKLVSADVVDKAEPPTDTVKSTEIETPRQKPDHDILKKLSSESEPSETTKTSEPSETETPDTQEVRRDILEQLTGSEEAQEKENQDNTNQGETPDA
jgi:RNA polymerase-interacting CarD/CdnL/TRCF family regulator